MSYSQINCFTACVMNPIGSPIIDHPSQGGRSRTWTVNMARWSPTQKNRSLLKKHHSQGISPGDVGLFFRSLSGPSLPCPAAMTGKEERHASEAHVAPTEARGAAGGCVDLWVCVQVIHTWACENNHGFSGKPMKSQKNIKAPSKKVFLEMFVATSWTKAWKSEAFAAPLACFNFSHLGCPPQFAQLPKLQR